MSWLEAFLLGLIQGLTEFLPVSSSGHLQIGAILLGVNTSNDLLFAVVLHTATALSTLVVFRRDIHNILTGLFAFKENEELFFSLKIILSMIPVGIVGIFLEDQIEGLFDGNPVLVGSALLFTGVLLFLTHYRKSNQKPVTYTSAVIIGVAQAIAIVPGISRSGATIATALFLGIEKSRATRFSFLMVLPPVFGAVLLKLKDYLEMGGSAAPSIAPSVLLVGFLVSFVSGYIACRWMLAIVRRGKLTYFAVYCLIVGLMVALFPLY